MSEPPAEGLLDRRASSIGYEEDDMARERGRLIAQDGRELQVGDRVRDFRGDEFVITDWAAPRHEGSSGRVYLRSVEKGYHGEYFPTVIEARIVV